MRRSRCNVVKSGPSFFQPALTIPAFIDSALTRPRAGLSGEAATRVMAEDMRQAAQREGGLSRDDMLLLGWTAAQIETLVPAARERAQALAGLTA
ncbi:hypothetical protein [Nitrobacter sp.]|uniref:hypothetical protein n=1 Tax=Nitrobacter sp. TaxID=29420 RepID=UPI003F64D794